MSTFFERYAALAEKRGLKPGSEEAAKLIGTKKSTISKWKTENITPIGSTVATIANIYGVSADYLLGRTDDPTGCVGERTTDTQKEETPIAVSSVIPFPGPDAGNDDSLIRLVKKLDPADRLRAEGVVQGLLMQEKYNPDPETLPNAAHKRTDIDVTQDMAIHDEGIMDDGDF